MLDPVLNRGERLQPDADGKVSGVKTGHYFEVGKGFAAHSFRHTGYQGLMDPLIMVDHYTMSQSTFGAHPHAGLAAVSLLFEDSQGLFHNRDSMGNDFDLQPGDLYWLNAAGGAVHDEAPRPGSVIHGLQVFVNLPGALKQGEPGSELVRASDMPVIENASCRVRIAMGSSNGLSGATSPVGNMTILDGTIRPSSSFSHQLKPSHNCWLYAVDGSFEVVFAQHAMTLNKGESVAIGHSAACLYLHNRQRSEARFAMFSGQAIKESFVQRGPFALGSEQQIEQAQSDYKAGKFGRVV